jgi:hypothetical protein
VLRPTTPREPKPSRFGLFRVRSPLLTESLICFLFLRVLRWFTSPGLPLPAYAFSGGSRNLPCEGLPHSEIPGSKPVCGSPRLIAACHVLHRFSAPRHPPSTLSSLTIKYLRRESFSFTRLSCQRSRSPRIKKPSEVDLLGEPSHPRRPLNSPNRANRHGYLRARDPARSGGAERNRTADLRLAKPPLSQLSYSPS